MFLKIYCDGSCSGNGDMENFGGYGIVITSEDKLVKEISVGAINTTNNRMELNGILESMKIAMALNANAEIISDSAYSVNLINDWMYSWANNNWIKKSNKKPPENLDLIKQIYDIMNFNAKITVSKVRGHNGDVFNEKADSLARQGTLKAQQNYLKKSKKMS